MAFGPRICACCGARDGVEEHYLYLRTNGCPDDLTVWLCHACHSRAHRLRRRINVGASAKAAARAANLRPIIAEVRATGVTTLAGVAAALVARGVPTLSGRGTWSRSSVLRLERGAETAA